MKFTSWVRASFSALQHERERRLINDVDFQKKKTWHEQHNPMILQNDQFLICWDAIQTPNTHPWKSLTYAIHQNFLIYLSTLWIRYLHHSESHTRPIPSWDLQPYDDESRIYITLWVISEINQHIQPIDCNQVSYSLFTKHKRSQTTWMGEKISKWRITCYYMFIHFFEKNTIRCMELKC